MYIDTIPQGKSVLDFRLMFRLFFGLFPLSKGFLQRSVSCECICGTEVHHFYVHRVDSFLIR